MRLWLYWNLPLLYTKKLSTNNGINAGSFHTWPPYNLIHNNENLISQILKVSAHLWSHFNKHHSQFNLILAEQETHRQPCTWHANSSNRPFNCFNFTVQRRMTTISVMKQIMRQNTATGTHICRSHKHTHTTEKKITGVSQVPVLVTF